MAAELTKRVAVAAVGIPLAVLVLYLGGWPLAILLALIAAIGAGEFIRIARLHEVVPPARLTVAAAAAVVVIAALQPTPARAAPWLWLLLTALLLFGMTAVIWTRGVAGRPLAASGAMLLAVLLTGGMLSYAVFLREALAHSPHRFAGGEPNAIAGGSWAGLALVAYPLAVTWINDTAAYFGGRTLGRRKLIPRVSPGKTVEGTVFGVLGSIVTSLLYAHFVFANWLDIPIGVAAAVVGGILLSAAAVLGDLAESLLKREAGVKDSGALLPGHGGVLDRFDALFFTLPVAYWFLHFAMQLGGGLR